MASQPTNHSPIAVAGLGDGVFSDRNSMLIVGLMALLLPPLVWVLNWLRCGNCLPASSVSQYYFTGGHAIFVGCMCIVGVLLFTYQGWRKSSNRLQSVMAKIAATSALGVGLIPTKLDPENLRRFTEVACHNLAENLNSIRLMDLTGAWEPKLHGICALLLFAWLIYVVRTQFTEKTGDAVEQQAPQRKEKRNRIYRFCTWLMGAGVAICVVHVIASYLTKGESDTKSILFYGETLALWAFGFAWLVKSRWLLGYKGQRYGYFQST